MEAAPLGPVMRRLLLAAAGLVFLAGVQLFLLSDHTETLFAWTVHPPLTAAFLGALYWAAGLLEWHAARSGTWAGARIAVPGVLAFTLLTNVPTWLNLDQYHLDSPAAWAWIGVYAVVPWIFLWALVAQRTHGFAAPTRQYPLPAVLRHLLGGAGVVFLVGGTALLASPDQAGLGWPWDLSPQVGSYTRFSEPYMGCWGIGLGVVAAHAWWEDDLVRLRPLWPAMIATALLCAVAALRYHAAVSWRHPSTEVMALGLCGLLGLGVWGELLTRRQRN